MAATSIFARCGCATLCATARLDGWELIFKGSKSGSYLTIEKCESGTVPLAIWEVTEQDEKVLNRYEGYPNFYYKREFKVKYKGIRTGKRRTATAFIYITHEERPIGVPSDFYMESCLEGYDTFYFNRSILLAAYNKSLEVCGYEKNNVTQIQICPRCGRAYSEPAALSRADNKVFICPDCGTREALDSIGIKPDEQEQILAAIYRRRQE